MEYLLSVNFGRRYIKFYISNTNSAQFVQTDYQLCKSKVEKVYSQYLYAQMIDFCRPSHIITHRDYTTYIQLNFMNLKWAKNLFINLCKEKCENNTEISCHIGYHV